MSKVNIQKLLQNNNSTKHEGPFVNLIIIFNLVYWTRVWHCSRKKLCYCLIKVKQKLTIKSLTFLQKTRFLGGQIRGLSVLH